MSSGPEAERSALTYFPALDGLRGLAILLVLPHNISLMSEPHSIASRLWVQVLDRGWIGVQLFFVLSGFLITRILLSTQRAPSYFASFYARRALRIFPVYYGTLIVWLLIFPALGLTALRDTRYDFSYWLFVCNWVQPFVQIGAGIAHFWSLAVEEQFYLIWPASIRKLTARGVFRLCMVLAVLSVLSRVAMLAAGYPAEAVYEFTPCRMDALALGGALAAAMADEEARQWMSTWSAKLSWLPVVLFLLGAVVSKGYRQFGTMAQTVGYSLLAAAFAAWVAAAVMGRLNRVESALLNSPVLRDFGKYSYAMYVIHYPFAFLVERRLYPGGMPGSLPLRVDSVYVAVMVTAVFILGALSYRFYESPFLQMKGRFTAFGN